MSEAKATRYEPIAVSAENTVVAEFIADIPASNAYQSEAELERRVHATLERSGVSVPTAYE